MLLIVVFGIFSMLYGVEGFPNGAPPSESCGLMYPLHDNYPAIEDPPVIVEVDRLAFEPGGVVVGMNFSF